MSPKKISLFTILFLSCLVSAFSSIDTTTNNQPNITLTFDEYAIIQDAHLRCCNPDSLPIVGAQRIDMTWEPADGASTFTKGGYTAHDAYTFTPDHKIPNGVHWLVIKATDLAQNTKTFDTYHFLVDGEMNKIRLVDTDEVRSFLVQDFYIGVAKIPDFNITVNIDSPDEGILSGSCKYTERQNAPWLFDSQDFDDFTITGGSTKDHLLDYSFPLSLVRANTATADYAKPLGIICKDEYDFLGYDNMYFFVDDTKPKIVEYGFDPDLVTEYDPNNQLSTNLKIKANEDEEVICQYKINDGASVGFDNHEPNNFTAYMNDYTQKMILPAGQYKNETKIRYDIYCQDRAGNFADTLTLTLRVNLDVPLGISIVEPKKTILNETKTKLVIQTTRTANCVYYKGTTSTTKNNMIKLSSNKHSSNWITVLDEGQNIFRFECKAIGFTPAKKDLALMVDTQGPKNIKVNGSSIFCDDDEIVFKEPLEISANDTASGIDRYEVKIEDDAGEILLEYTETSSVLKTIDRDEDGLPFNFSDGDDVTLEFRAIDKAGNIGDTLDYTVTYDPTNAYCAVLVCGDKICDVGENISTCRADCLDCSADGFCQEDCEDYDREDPDCEEVVDLCGNGVCNTDETQISCPQDCKPVICDNDQICDTNETCSCIDCDGENSTCSVGYVCEFDSKNCIRAPCPTGEIRCPDGECRIDCGNITDTTLKLKQDKEKSIVPWIFLIIGILLILGGGGYLLYKKNLPPKESKPDIFGMPRREEGSSMRPQVDMLRKLSPQEQKKFEERAKLLQERRKRFKEKKESQRLELFKAFGGLKKEPATKEEKKIFETKEQLEDISKEGWLTLQELNLQLKTPEREKIVKKGNEPQKIITKTEFDKLTKFVDERNKVEKEVESEKALKAEDKEIFDKLSEFVEKKKAEAKGEGFTREIPLTKEEEELVEKLSKKSEDLFDLLPRPKRELDMSEFDFLEKLGGKGGEKTGEKTDDFEELKKRIEKLGTRTSEDDFEEIEELSKEKRSKKKYDIPEELKAIAEEKPEEKKSQKKNNKTNNNKKDNDTKKTNSNNNSSKKKNNKK